MKKSIFTIQNIQQLTQDVYQLTLSGDTSAITAPGQFVNIEIPRKFLRRPISVCDWKEGKLFLLVKEVGGGTQELVHSALGTKLDILSGLGNGFDLSVLKTKKDHLFILIGGGIGIAPLYGLARAIKEKGIDPIVILGFSRAADIFYLNEFTELGCELVVSTEDGSYGVQGFVTDCIQEKYLKTDKTKNYVFCCGPLPMLRAVYEVPQVQDGQYSFEARMGCGFGACMGCSLSFRDGMKRICTEGSVFFQEEIAW